MRHHLLLGIFAASTMIGAAVAQTNPPSSATSPSLAPSAATPGGIQTAQTVTTTVRYVTMTPADLLASKFIGTNVYNKQNESIGEIEDLVIENGKTVTGVVIGVGGFLGIGERYVAVDPSTMVLTHQDNNWRAVVDTTKDNLKNAPAFDYHKRNK